jgi:hypothetical protein
MIHNTSPIGRAPKEESKSKNLADHSVIAREASAPYSTDLIIKKVAAAPGVVSPLQGDRANTARLRRETLAREWDENSRQFRVQPWWQEQNRLWYEANYYLDAPLVRNLEGVEGSASAALVRMTLVRNSDAEIPAELRVRAIESGNSELIKLIVYRQADNLTLEDYQIAIQNAEDAELLTWMIEVMGLTTTSDLSGLQSITARFTSSTEFMAFVLTKTGVNSTRESVIEAIKNGNYNVFLKVWDAFSDQPEDRLNAWLQFTSTAINHGEIARLSKIVPKWPQSLPKSDDIYDAAFETPKTEVFHLLLTHDFPFPEDGYNRLLIKFRLTLTSLNEQMVIASSEFNQLISYKACFIRTAITLIFLAVIIYGALVYDDISDMAPIVIGVVCFLVNMCGVSDLVCLVAKYEIDKNKIKNEITNISEDLNRTITMLTNHDKSPGLSDLDYAATNNLPQEVLAQLTESAQSSHDRLPGALHCFSQLFGANRQIEPTQLATQETSASPA